MSKSVTSRPRAVRQVQSLVAIIAASVCCVAAAGQAAAQGAQPAPPKPLRVVVSSKPIHALVAAVTEGVTTPTVLISGAASPHTYAMKPSEARLAHDAQVFFRVGEDLEPFTAKLVAALPRSVKVVSLVDAPGLALLDRREDPAFEDDHDDHKHGHDKKAGAGSERDPHIWLDPQNAATMIDHIAAVLSDAAPASAATFKANAAAARKRIDDLGLELKAKLAPAAGRPFVVLHDAYQYLERRYGLTAVGAIAVNPERAPSGKRLAAIRRKIASSGASCIFAEPGMQPKVVAAVAEGGKVRTAVLDPEATRLNAGAGLYAELMHGLATGIVDCLGPR